MTGQLPHRPRFSGPFGAFRTGERSGSRVRDPTSLLARRVMYWNCRPSPKREEEAG